MIRKPLLMLCALLSLNLTMAIAQSNTTAAQAKARYLGNEGVMVSHSGIKILFDPFFHNSFNHYQLVPKSIHNAIMNGAEPYDNIDAIFISHAHEDHFSAVDMLKFLQAHPKAKLIAPKQAIDELSRLKSHSIMSQVTAVSLAYGDKPWTRQFGDLLVEAVRIPHAGWPDPARTAVENMVFRVTLKNLPLAQEVTVMHMGDADPNDKHFKPYKNHWMKQQTDTAFPPYWFFLSPQGNQILETRINARRHVGVHVPIKVPQQLRASGKDYLSVPGDVRDVNPVNKVRR